MNTTTLPASVVLYACNSYISEFDNKKQKFKDKLYAKHVGRRTWFGLGCALTRDDVDNIYAEDIHWNRLKGSFWYWKVLDLQKLTLVAKANGTDVTIDDEMASVLEKYFRN